MRWTSLTIDHLRAAGYGTIVDRARALAAGPIDPAQEAIDNATARVRRAVGVGNALDLDAGKVPNSLKGTTEKLALYDLMERIGMPLSAEQQQKLHALTNDLDRQVDHRIPVEEPDNPIGAGEMQTAPEPCIAPRTRRFTARTTDGL